MYAAWGLPKPRNISNILGSWLNEIPKDSKPLVLVGVSALCWSVWLYRSIVVFRTNILLFCRLSNRLRDGFTHELSFNGILPMGVLVAASYFLE